MSGAWNPLLRIDQVAVLGLHEGALWIGTEDGPQRPVADNGFVGLLPLLENPYGVLVSVAEAKSTELGWPRDRLKTMIGLTELPIYAASMDNSYWSLLALKWLREIGPTAENKVAVEDLAANPRLTQEVNHEALRLKRQWAKRLSHDN